jgi:hypothetical protein
MKKLLLIYLLAMLSFCMQASAQSYFKIIKGSVEMQVLSRNGDSLAIGYHVIYFDSSNSAYTGTISTYYITGTNKTPASCTDVFNTADLPDKKLNSGDTAKIYTHVKVSSHYFENGNGNIIVIWPTGDKNGKKTFCKDSVIYPKKIIVINLAGIKDVKNTFDPVNIYPNPAQAWLSLEMKDPGLKIKMVRVTDVSGKEVINTRNPIEKIDVSGLKTGSYFLEVDCGTNQKATYPFIINR